MKRKWKLVMPLAAALCILFSMNAFAENSYKFITGGSSKAEATNIDLGQEYAASLLGDECLYFKFTTPSQKGFFDFYANTKANRNKYIA